MTRTEAPTQERQTIQIGDQEIPTIYCNNVQLRVSAWDFRFMMGEVVDSTEKELTLKNKATIYMSPEHAKAFAQVLMTNIAEYEKNVGKIPNPGQAELMQVDGAKSG